MINPGAITCCLASIHGLFSNIRAGSCIAPVDLGMNAIGFSRAVRFYTLSTIETNRWWNNDRFSSIREGIVPPKKFPCER